MAESSLLERSQDVSEVDRSGLKVAATILVPAILALAASYLFLAGHNIWSIVLILLFINLFALQAFLLKNSSQVWLALALSTLGLVIPFYSINLNYLATAALVIFFFFVTGAFPARHELNNSLKLSFSRVARKVMVGGMTGIAGGITVLIVSGALGSSVFSIGNIDKYVVDPYIVAPAVEYATHQTYVPNETVKDFLTNQIESSVVTVNGNSISVGSLPASEKNLVVSGAISSSVSQINSSMGVSIDVNSSISDNLLNVMGQKVSQLGQPMKLIVILSLYIILWSTVLLLATILAYVLTVIAFLIFEFLVMTKFAEVQMESRSHEVVTLQ